MKNNFFHSNPYEIGILRAGDEDFGCRMMDFECLEARCSGAADLEEWEKKIFLSKWHRNACLGDA